MSTTDRCTARHPLSDVRCMKPAGHDAFHYHRADGRRTEWTSSVDIDQRTASGGRVRFQVAEISVERSER